MVRQIFPVIQSSSHSASNAETRRRQEAAFGKMEATRVRRLRSRLMRFQAGPFAGLDGVVNVDAGEDRVFVLLAFLGKINKVKVNRDWLVAAA